jgi:transcriptional regulator with GAF, ATPase, and Fis domain
MGHSSPECIAPRVLPSASFWNIIAGVMTMDGIALDYPSVVNAYEHLVEEQGYREGRCHPEGGFQEIIGASAALTGVLQQVALVAPTDATVLL